MQHFRKHTRRRWFFITGAIALMTALVLVPLRAVAQGAKTSAGKAEPPAGKAEAPAGKAAAPAGKTDEPAKTSEPTPRSNSGRDGRETRGGSRGGWRGVFPTQEAVEEARAKYEKLIVGTWRGGDADGNADGEVVFNVGGVFDESPVTLHAGTIPKGEEKVQGRWSLEATVPPSLRLEVDQARVSLRGLPGRRQSVRSKNFEIILLDENLFRFREGVSNGQTYFFRRVADPAEKAKLADDLPESIRRLATFAELSPEDASALAQPNVDWLKEWQVSDSQLKLIERVALARRGQLDLAELFELSKEEAAAYAELYQMTQANFKAIEQLADKEQLTPLELGAVKKLRTARDEFERGIGAMKIGIAKIRLGDRDVAPKLDAKTLQALGKLYPAIDRIAEFPNATVFAEPGQKQPAAGKFGGGFRGEN
jgi:hypothetical protein